MANPFFSGRIPPGLADKIDARLLTTGETRSELLIRLLRAEINDNKDTNENDNKYDNNINNILADLRNRVEKLEQAANNKPDNTTDLSYDDKDDNILIDLMLHSGDDKPDNQAETEVVTADNNFNNNFDNSQIDILQDNLLTVELTPVQLADLKKINERVGKVIKTKSKKLLDLGLIVQIGEDLILSKLGEAVLAES